MGRPPPHRRVASHGVRSLRATLAAALLVASAAVRLRRDPGTQNATQYAAAPSVDHLRNLGSGMYTMDLKLGGQRLCVMPDTGSFTLLVTSKQCEKGECPIRAFDPSLSKSYHRIGDVSEQVFGTGTLSSVTAEDNLALGPFAPRKHMFREITKLDSRMANFWNAFREFDGILGLGRPGAAKRMSVLSKFDVGSFAVCLRRRFYNFSADAWGENPSRFYWGRPAELGAPKFTYLELDDYSPHWSVKLSNVAFRRSNGGVSKLACWDFPCLANIDTGASILSMSIVYYQKFSEVLGKVRSDCSNFDGLPQLEFRLGGEGNAGIDIKLPPRAYIEHLLMPGRTIPSWSPLCKINGECGKSNQSMTTCTPLFGPHDLSDTEMWLLGAPFLMEFMAEYDRGSKPPRIGLAPHSERCPGVAGSDVEAPALASGVGLADVEVPASGDWQRPPDARALLAMLGGGGAVRLGSAAPP